MDAFWTPRCKRLSESSLNCVWHANDSGTLFTVTLVLRDGVYTWRWHEVPVVTGQIIQWAVDNILRSWVDFSSGLSAQMRHCASVSSFSSFYVPLSLKWLSATVCMQYRRSCVKCIYLHSVSIGLNQQYRVAFLCDFVYNIPDLGVPNISKYHHSHFTSLVRTDIHLLQIQIFCWQCWFSAEIWYYMS